MSDVNRTEYGIIADKGGYVDFAFVDIGGFELRNVTPAHELGVTPSFSGGLL